jgi:hypothetical protein
MALQIAVCFFSSEIKGGQIGYNQIALPPCAEQSKKIDE